MSRLTGKIITGQTIKELTVNGVYKIHHIDKKGVFYVGSASRETGGKDCRKGFYRRFLEHIHFLENKKHTSPFLQNVVNKYGVEGLRFEVLEIVNPNNREFILEREQYYIDTLKPAYNGSITARCPTVPYTDARRKAASDRRIGKKLPESAYEKIKVEISQYNNEGLFIGRFNSIQEASDITGIDRSSISRCYSGKRKSAGGFNWICDNPKEAREQGFLK
jgi:hypothetical protein